ncbi:tRNA (adenosine(37)-N6)-dimethylallyltransferase MiaA [Dyadobacter bucti]|uniref:tRNA (adenosine(37)-N6)-dimethylallyltransferase MiaA n=1 Tax=Dyadobacter bucti TaxID=2572203 RepID=UPI003F71E422
MTSEINPVFRQFPLLVILGPTASGKTHLATQVADQLNGEIISADSRQVYRDMNIGTGKDLEEYCINGKNIPYHLIDILDAGQQYNVSEYQADFRLAFLQVAAEGHCPVVCGGTGFYIHSVLQGHAYFSIPVSETLRTALESLSTTELLARFQEMDTSYRTLADTSTRKRLIRAIEISTFLKENPEEQNHFTRNSPTYQSIVFGLNPPLDVRRERISRRLKFRLENGLIEEVEALLARGLTPAQLIYYGLEYKFVTNYLTGQLPYQEMAKQLETEIHRFAKRQMTFFRKMEKDGIPIRWLDFDLPDEEQIRIVTAAYKEFQHKMIAET